MNHCQKVSKYCKHTRKKEGRVNEQIIDNNSERANEYAEKERFFIRKRKSFFFLSIQKQKQISDFLTGKI
jgi:hypothetical protein